MGRRLEYEVKTSVRLNMSNPQHVKINDVIQNGRNGVLVPPGNIEKFARALEQLMGNAEERERLARHAIADCQQFDEEHIIREWTVCLA